MFALVRAVKVLLSSALNIARRLSKYTLLFDDLDGPRQVGYNVLFLLVFSQISLRIVQNGFKDPKHPSRHEPSPSMLAIIEFLKLAFSFIYLGLSNLNLISSPLPSSTALPFSLVLRNSRSTLPYRPSLQSEDHASINSSLLYSRRSSALPSPQSSSPTLASYSSEAGSPPQLFNDPLCAEHTEEDYVYDKLYLATGEDSTDRDYNMPWPSKLCIKSLFPLAASYVLRNFVASLTPQFVDPRTAHIVNLSLIIFTGVQVRAVLGQSLPPGHWASAFLQITAVLIVDLFTKFKSYNGAAYAFMFASIWLNSSVLIATSYVYKLNRKTSFHKINIIVFSFTLAGYAVAAIANSFTDIRLGAHEVIHRSVSGGITRNDVASAMVLILHALRDIAALAVLRGTSPVTFCAMALLSTALTPFFSYICFNPTAGFSSVQKAASVLAVYAAWSHLSQISTPPSPSHDNTENIATRSNMPKVWPPRRSAVFFVSCLFCSLGYVFSTTPLLPLPTSRSTFVWNGSTLGSPLPLPHKLLPSSPPWPSPECKRKPLPPSSAYAGPGSRPDDFHTFDDILVVVFFSHARYDANLDGYREVYSRYFPNILFIGPGSREDQGFLNSYDVAVDSFESEEDLSKGWYKMGGRMAHHMFYTAVKDNPCYAGYLWAPFDALLNVPRLAQFPQDRIWYHSPYGEYMPNPAPKSGLHAPPARVSEETPRKYAEIANDWGATWKWWWGESHAGLEVCMTAYQQVPQRMRDRLQGLTGAPDRFVAGSSDTMYVPGYLRDDLLDALGIFLQTNCFLEIALPTTLHMILPNEQRFVYVDHWWTNQPPLNITFVRQKWEEGYEVDSFHTFHWGDVHDNGMWRANEKSVDDVREVLRDSFIRQGMDLPLGVVLE